MPESFVPSNGYNIDGDSPSLGQWLVMIFGGFILFITYYSVFAIIDKEGSLKHYEHLEEDENVHHHQHREEEEEELEKETSNSRNYVMIFGVILLLLIYGYYLFCPDFNFSIFMIQIVVSLSLFYIFGICIHSRHHDHSDYYLYDHHHEDMLMMNNEHEIGEREIERENDTVSFIKNWLTNEVKLPQYLDHFIKAGYNDIMSVITLTHLDLEEMGVNKKGHRKKIMIVVDKFLVDSYSKMIQLKGNNNEYDGDLEQIDEPFEF